MPQTTQEVCTRLASVLTARGWMLATAESCTGGMIASACTDLSGSSTWFDRGFVTYSNAAKSDMLGVDAHTIALHGAVSEQVARAMAAGVLAHANAQVSIAVTGVAGPTGGSAAKPVGTVWFAWGTPQGIHSQCVRFEGDRAAVRRAAALHALTVLCERIQGIAT